MVKKEKDIFIVPFERGYQDIRLNLDSANNEIVFSDAFWTHFTTNFPSATIALFNRRNDDYDNVIKLSDSSYNYGLISERNKIFFLNHLPKNLSKEESKSYREGIGFFTVSDSTDNNDLDDPEVPLESHWRKAPEEIEKEYLHFYSLINDNDKEYAIVAKKALIDSILKKYQ